VLPICGNKKKCEHVRRLKKERVVASRVELMLAPFLKLSRKEVKHTTNETYRQGRHMLYLNAHIYYLYTIINRGRAVAQLVEALRYKPERRGFDLIPWHNRFGRTMALGSTQPLTEMSTRNISLGGGGGEGDRCVGLTTLPPSCADCLEIWEPQPSGTLRVCPGL
jgi:hypothetical protein